MGLVFKWFLPREVSSRVNKQPSNKLLPQGDTVAVEGMVINHARLFSCYCQRITTSYAQLAIALGRNGNSTPHGLTTLRLGGIPSW
jgi:hypothetical protein